MNGQSKLAREGRSERVGMFGSDKGGISGLHVIVRIFDDSLSLYTVINNDK